MPNENQQVLKSLLEVVNTKGKITDFVEAFKFAVETLNKMKAATGAELSQLRITFDQAVKDLQSANLKDFTDIKGQVLGQIATALKEQQDSLNYMRDWVRNIPQAQNGADGIDGKDADEQAIITAVLAQIPSPTIPDAYDDAEIQAQIDEHTKAIEELKSKGGNVAGWGAHPLNIYQSGTIKAETARHLNFGTNLTVSQSTDGVTTINATGGSGMSVLAATGNVDNSNVIFTFASTPTLVIVNGATYRNGHGVTIVTTTATLDNPVGTGGDIYALG